jgi:hypothetical protein
MIPLVVYRKLDKNNIFKNLKLSLFLLIWCMELQLFETTNSRTHGYMRFVETTKIDANE